MARPKGFAPAKLTGFVTLPCMDYLFTPWRYAYVTNFQRATSCIFCDRAPAQADKADKDEENLIVYRGPHCFIVVNRYPYTSGHVMVVPYQHIDRLDLLPAEAATEMMVLTQRMEGVLRRLYSPDGINLGMNLGRAAGAGVAGHMSHAYPASLDG